MAAEVASLAATAGEPAHRTAAIVAAPAMLDGATTERYAAPAAVLAESGAVHVAGPVQRPAAYAAEAAPSGRIGSYPFASLAKCARHMQA